MLKNAEVSARPVGACDGPNRDARFDGAEPLYRPAGTPQHAAKMASRGLTGKGQPVIAAELAHAPRMLRNAKVFRQTARRQGISLRGQC
jgi:hypothetical protein